MSVATFKRAAPEDSTMEKILKNYIADGATAVIVDIERQPTAKECCHTFFSTINALKSKAEEKAAMPDAVRIAAVGLRIENRGGCFDLLWFSANNRIFAVDAKDSMLCYEMMVS